MGKVTKRDKDALNQLVLDCSMYNFNERDALVYIKTRFGKGISDRTYRRYKANLENGNISQEWMKNFTRIGFVVTQQQVFEGAKHLLESTMRRLLREENKEEDKQDDYLILKLKEEIRQESKLVSEFSLGTPILSNIKEQMQNLEKRLHEKEQMLRTERLSNHGILSC